MNFGEALEIVKNGGAIGLPNWKPDVKIKMKKPDEHSKITHPYLYSEIVKIVGANVLPNLKPDVKIKMQKPDEHSKMTHTYLYVESRFGCVPWEETFVELLSEEWEER